VKRELARQLASSLLYRASASKFRAQRWTRESFRSSECDESSHRFRRLKALAKGSGVIGNCYAGELAAYATTLFYTSWHLHHYGCNAASETAFDSGAKLDLMRDTTNRF